jgi:hypothetical protein
MTTLPSPGTRKFPEDSLEKQVYNLVESISEYLPITNDKNRLAFGLYKFVIGQGDPPDIILKSAKIKVIGISLEELENKLSAELKEIKSKVT